MAKDEMRKDTHNSTISQILHNELNMSSKYFRGRILNKYPE